MAPSPAPPSPMVVHPVSRSFELGHFPVRPEWALCPTRGQGQPHPRAGAATPGAPLSPAPTQSRGLQPAFWLRVTLGPGQGGCVRWPRAWGDRKRGQEGPRPRLGGPGAPAWCRVWTFPTQRQLWRGGPEWQHLVGHRHLLAWPLLGHGVPGVVRMGEGRAGPQVNGLVGGRGSPWR